MKLPKYREHKPTGQALVEYQGDRKYLGRYNTPESRRRYRAFIQKILDERGLIEDQQQPALAEVELVDDLIIAFLRWGKTNFPAKEFAQFGYATTHLSLACGEVPATNFNPKDMKKARESMVEAGWKREHINRQVGRLKRVFKWGVEQTVVPLEVYGALTVMEPLKQGQSKAAESPPVEPVADAVVDATLPYLGRHARAMVELQRLAGMRPQDACNLRPCDVDQTGAVWIYRPEQHKGTWRGKGRVIFFGPKCQAVLKPFMDRDPQAYCFSPKEAEAERSSDRRAARKTKVQPSQAARRPRKLPKRPRGERYSTETYGGAIDYGIKKANQFKCQIPVPHWSPGQLRHTAGTDIRKKYGLEAAQVFLGHAKADVTQIYAERDLDLGRKIASEVG